MEKITLTANTPEQQRVKEYLEQNVSDILANKINNGVKTEKDGKTLINKKDIDGFMKYACEEARKLAENGARCACVADNVVFGWAVHYFGEDSIIGVLYNEDGTEHSRPEPVRTTAPKKDKPKAEKPKAEKPKKAPPEQNSNQFSLFDLCG